MADMFGYDKHVISLFAANDQLVLYKDAKYWKTIKLPGDKKELLLTHVHSEGKVSVLFQDGAKLVNFIIDIENEVADEKTFAGAGSSYERTKSHYKFEHNGKIKILSQDMKVVGEYANDAQYSSFDDSILTGTHLEIEDQKIALSNEKDCSQPVRIQGRALEPMRLVQVCDKSLKAHKLEDDKLV